jgi:hypothetical protein
MVKLKAFPEETKTCTNEISATHTTRGIFLFKYLNVCGKVVIWWWEAKGPRGEMRGDKSSHKLDVDNDNSH